MRQSRGRAVLISGIVFLMSVASSSFADDDDTGVKSHGVIYNVAEDRRMEKIGGVYQPEDLDKYMKRHFDSLEQKLDNIASRLDTMAQQIQNSQTGLRSSSGVDHS